MPIIKSAKKALRGSEKKRVFNIRRKRAMKDAVKDVSKSILDKNKSEAESKLSVVYKAIDKAVKRGIIKKNNAARKKSRIVKAINKIETK